jgi:predicted MPP superfamily phosphohydrolase
MKYLVKVFILLLAGCNSSEQPKITASDDLQHILYSGGDIITISRLSSAISERASPREIFFVWGYHELWHGELSRSLLNELAREQPIAIIHRSFHEIFLNDATINALGNSEKEFRANPQVDWDKGHFYEGGWMALAPKMAPLLLDGSRYMRGLGLMTELIKKNGMMFISFQMALSYPR